MKMKYLNKIIFINSANIPYAEISVDGNVHFTGTQGVGKSTVLRALLFFYNADKQHLGIQQGQKSFDEFYFRQSNSYILYEVIRDNGAYTILVGRYQGRASWRFIDAPYQREWLIDDDKQVLSDWVKIRERIDKDVAVSARIESGVMFKDIIFGNTHDHKYARYALVQSSHYQNIPRSIQNVFLNTKLDADFVKKIKVNDIMVAGFNFGCGSSREHAPIAIKASGISCVIAKSFARIFYRNAINIGLPILECVEASERIDDKDEVEINFDTGEIINKTKNETYQAQPFPAFIQNIMQHNGLLNAIKEQGGK